MEENNYTKLAKEVGSAQYWELLALSRMTGEQISNELSENERKEYEKSMRV